MVPITARTTNAQWIRTVTKSGRRESVGEAQKNRSEKALTAVQGIKLDSRNQSADFT